MFNIGYLELMLILIIGLLVIGPQRLPDVARKLMLWHGRLTAQFSKFKQTLEEEIGADDIRQQLHNESVMQDLKKSQAMLESMKQEMQSLHQAAKLQNTSSADSAENPSQEQAGSTTNKDRNHE